MITFYAQLFGDTTENREYIQLLNRLTRLSLQRLRMLKVDYVWDIWA